MDGDEAMDWLLAQETLPDLILLDCMMPNMSGHEFCTLLRQVRLRLRTLLCQVQTQPRMLLCQAPCIAQAGRPAQPPAC